jgi:hypothetical protein
VPLESTEADPIAQTLHNGFFFPKVSTLSRLLCWNAWLDILKKQVKVSGLFVAVLESIQYLASESRSLWLFVEVVEMQRRHYMTFVAESTQDH